MEDFDRIRITRNGGNLGYTRASLRHQVYETFSGKIEHRWDIDSLVYANEGRVSESVIQRYMQIKPKYFETKGIPRSAHIPDPIEKIMKKENISPDEKIEIDPARLEYLTERR